MESAEESINAFRRVVATLFAETHVAQGSKEWAGELAQRTAAIGLQLQQPVAQDSLPLSASDKHIRFQNRKLTRSVTQAYSAMVNGEEPVSSIQHPMLDAKGEKKPTGS